MHAHFPPTLLTNRRIIQASGADVAGLLQDLLSCNMESLDERPIIWGFLLTPQGRFLHEIFVLKHDGRLLLDVQADQVESFLKRLKLYTLKRDAVFELLEHWAVAGAVNTLENNAHLTVSDPRLESMGRRLYGEREALAALPDITTDMTGYNEHRAALGIPAAEDFIPEKTLLLDYDVDQLGGVDFEKGCYIGQEVTARMHYRAINKKGIYLITAADNQPLPPQDTAITAGDKEAGRLLTVAGHHAIAMLRHELADGTLLADRHAVQAARPDWIQPQP